MTQAQVKKMNNIFAISPLDGRYSSKVSSIQPIMSEYGLIYYRLFVEIHWLIVLTETRKIKEASALSKAQKHQLLGILDNFSEADANHIKEIEKTTNHDVKAIEYFLQEQLTRLDLQMLIPFVHFACTSEDINNLAYALMLKEARNSTLLPMMHEVTKLLKMFSHENSDISMLSRTHGQPASPTTLGKEFANFAHRLDRQINLLENQPILAKINGAVGNFNAHKCAYSNIDWPNLSKKFIESLGLIYNPFTTQIENHDSLAELLQAISRFNTILIGLNRDIWSYISIGYFNQKKVENEVGSSTMPHKINPIDFENSEGNLGIANAIADHLAQKLPISRWQRDLSDSTVLRNLGTVFGYSLIAYQATLKGLQKLEVNSDAIHADLNQHWEVLGEAIQTVMRRYGITDAYEQLKKFSRGEKLTQEKIALFIKEINIPDDAKNELLKLTPHNYIGYANILVKDY